MFLTFLLFLQKIADNIFILNISLRDIAKLDGISWPRRPLKMNSTASVALDDPSRWTRRHQSPSTIPQDELDGNRRPQRPLKMNSMASVAHDDPSRWNGEKQLLKKLQIKPQAACQALMKCRHCSCQRKSDMQI